MIQILLIIAGAVFMFRLAEFEGRSGEFWAMDTIALCIAAAILIDFPVLNILAGVAAAFLMMTLSKLRA